MTQLTAQQVADLWVGAGGPKSRVIEWVAIALGESSYDTAAVSSAGAIGLWQIMPFHAQEFGITVDSLYDGRTNALVTVSLSGQGTNCAAWDSAYRDINASGRYSFLAFPEKGSADYNNISIVAGQLGGNPGIITPTSVPPWDDADYTKALAHSQFMTQRYLPATARNVLRNRAAVNHLFVRGWRPWTG